MIRYIERLKVQFRQCGKPIEAVVDKIEDGFYFLKGLSPKYDRYLMVSVKAVKNKNKDKNTENRLSIGNTLRVEQLPCYHVINEAFHCAILA
jgi:hypothetical protein